MLSVQTLGTFVPDDRLSLVDLAESISLRVDEINALQKFYGLRTVAKSDSSFEHLVETALQDLMRRATFDPATIDLILYTHTAYEVESFPNNLLNRILRRLGFVNATAFGIHSNNCASLISAFDVAQQYIGKSGAQGIIVTADLTFTDIMRHIPNTTVCGDAAAACLVNTRPTGTRLLALEIDTFGAHAKGTWQEKAAQMTFENHYAPRLAAVMQRSLDIAGVSWSDLRWVFPHNVNLPSWRKVTELLKIPMDMLYLEQLPALGHCFGADVLLNWAKAKAAGQLKVGDHIMLATVGLGAIFGAALFQCGADE